MLTLCPWNSTKPMTVLNQHFGGRLQTQTLALLQSSPALLTPPRHLKHKAFGCAPLGKQCFISSHLSLVVNDLQDTPHGVILHQVVMLAYACHDLWPSAAAIFSILAKVWHELSYKCVSLFPPSLSSVLELASI